MTTVTDKDLARLTGTLMQMSRDEMEQFADEQEQSLIDELQRLHDAPLPRGQQRARLQEIRDERIAIDRIRDLWRDLHRPEDAGPSQVVG